MTPLSKPELELAWAAGFFDGEGTTYLHPGHSLCVQIGQADREALDRFKAAVGGRGIVAGPYEKCGGRKPMYYYRVQASEEALGVIQKLLPLLCSQKVEQANSAIERWRLVYRPRENGKYLFCNRGHSLQDAYIAPDGGRECRTCRKDRRASLWSKPVIQT